MKAPVVRCVILTGSNLVVGRRAVVRPRLLRHHLARNSLRWRRLVSTGSSGKDMGHTSKSCRLRISVREGRCAIRSFRAFSSSVTTTSVFTTVSRSTGPRLAPHRSAQWFISCSADILFLGRQVVRDSIRRMDRIVFRTDPVVNHGTYSISTGTHVASLPAYFRMILLPPVVS